MKIKTPNHKLTTLKWPNGTFYQDIFEFVVFKSLGGTPGWNKVMEPKKDLVDLQDHFTILWAE